MLLSLQLQSNHRQRMPAKKRQHFPGFLEPIILLLALGVQCKSLCNTSYSIEGNILRYDAMLARDKKRQIAFAS